MRCRRRIRRAWPVLTALAVLAACDEAPTAPAPVAPHRDVAVAPTSGPDLLAVDLGALPGDAGSEATYVAEDGVVYGRSFGANGARFFRWTATGGMTQVSAIPAPARPPLPTFPNGKAFAANSKGEATGAVCWPLAVVCHASQPTFGDDAFAVRYSPGAGVVPIDTRYLAHRAGDRLKTSIGYGINRWGHVAGVYEDFTDDPRTFVWTPIDSFRIIAVDAATDLGLASINDIDQAIGVEGGFGAAPTSAVWRPDLGRRRLLWTSGVDLDVGAIARAQQIRGTLVVGKAGPHAALWRVPAVNRAAFPTVNANPYGGTASTIRLSSGGRYYQLYKATQSAASGPYLELVDWGDGTSSRRTGSSIGVVTSQNHLYAKTGTYWVRVYVKDAKGRWGVDERKLTVTQ
jgi:hypothetical protein